MEIDVRPHHTGRAVRFPRVAAAPRSSACCVGNLERAVSKEPVCFRDWLSLYFAYIYKFCFIWGVAFRFMFFSSSVSFFTYYLQLNVL